MPKPELVILGTSPVAIALSELASSLGYYCTVCVKDDQRHQFVSVDQVLDGYSKQNTRDRQRFIVISTQGKGDEEAVQQALNLPSTFISFVGSKAKAMSLRQKFMEAGSNLDVFDKIKVPAGLDLGAITQRKSPFPFSQKLQRFVEKGTGPTLWMQTSNPILRNESIPQQSDRGRYKGVHCTRPFDENSKTGNCRCSP